MPQVKTELEAARLRLEAAVNGPKMASREIAPGDGNHRLVPVAAASTHRLGSAGVTPTWSSVFPQGVN